MNLDDTVTQATLNWSCQAQVVLSVINFFKLMYSYLITTQNSAWFYSSLHQQNCALDDSDQRTFSLNFSDWHLNNVSTTSSDISTVSMSFSEASDMIWTDYDDSTDLALTATSSLSISFMNFSIWAIDVSSAIVQLLWILFSDQTSMKKVSRNMICFFLFYCYVIEIL